MTTNTELRARFELPLPPGINQQYATVQGRRVLSKASRQYKKNVGKIIRRLRVDGIISDALVAALRQGFVGLFIDFYFETPRRRDLDGGLKIAQDAICDSLGVNDNRVVDVHLVKRIDPLRPHIEVELEAILDWEFDTQYVYLGERSQGLFSPELSPEGKNMREAGVLELQPIGRVVKGRAWSQPESREGRQQGPDTRDRARWSEIAIDAAWAEALDGIEGFSHIWVVWWLDRFEDPPTSSRVHPEGRPEMPLVGLFATRSPRRPCPIAITAVRLLAHEDTLLRVEGLDACEGTPVLDIKPYLRRGDLIPEAKAPDWLEKLWCIHDEERAA